MMFGLIRLYINSYIVRKAKPTLAWLFRDTVGLNCQFLQIQVERERSGKNACRNVNVPQGAAFVFRANSRVWQTGNRRKQ